MGSDPVYLLIYNYSNQSGPDVGFLKKHNIKIKYAKTDSEALKIAKNYRVGVFLAIYDSDDLAPVVAHRKMMKHYPYIQRFLLSSNVNTEMLGLAINKAHINYFLPLPSENKTILLFIEKAFRRYTDVQRTYDKLGRFADVTLELVEDIEKYHEEANQDSLTGVLNRRSFDNVLNRYYSLYKRKKIPFVLAILDLDKFKNINDKYGHTAGDLVLSKFASTMKSSSRLGEDFVFRYGGEEFAVLSQGNSAVEMEIYLNRLKQNVQNLNVVYEDRSIIFTFSAGIAVIKKKIKPQDLIRNADAALYYAKSHGRNLIISYKKKLIKTEPSGQDL